MAAYDERARATALAKIKQYGKPITLVKIEGDPAWVKSLSPATRKYIWTNSETGEVVTVDPTLPKTYKGYGLQDKWKGSVVPGLTIQVGDVRIWAVAIPTPSTGDIININGQAKKVVTANPVQPGEIVVMWDIQLR